MPKHSGILGHAIGLSGQKRALMACLQCTTCFSLVAKSRLIPIRLGRYLLL